MYLSLVYLSISLLLVFIVVAGLVQGKKLLVMFNIGVCIFPLYTLVVTYKPFTVSVFIVVAGLVQGKKVQVMFIIGVPTYLSFSSTA